MADTLGDSTSQAALVWSNTLTVLQHNALLTARDKGWFEGVKPEAIFGTTIVLCVSNAETQQALQNELNSPLLTALKICTGKDMFPAFRIVPQSEYQEKAAQNSSNSLSHQAQNNANLNKNKIVTDNTVLPVDNISVSSSNNLSSVTANNSSPVQPDFDHATGISTLQQTDISTEQAAQQKMPVSVQRDAITHLNTCATFDTFVPGDSNRFARTVALAVAEGSGRDFNPLCIYGGSGLGKTHLLNAIGNYALVKDSSLKVRYVTSEEFTNEFIEALQTPNQSQGQIADFNRRYREVDVLLIDDIQFLGGKEATLEQFFHTFNSLYQANKRIVIASDVAPKNLKGFEARLISRFESGLTVDIKPPDLETRIAILRMMASMNHCNVPSDVLDLIAERFTENIRELEGALTRVTAVASLSNQPVSKALAEQALQDFFATDIEVRPTDIISQVAQYFHMTFDELVGRQRTKNVALARQIAMYLAREMTSMSLVDIGEVFGGRDHTTVMHAYTRVSGEMQEKQEIYNYVMELTVRLKQNPVERRN
ncbi:chromosomal replication initiator protein DnaA [Gardnerella swidsinskii]|jgi:chromosomal replication initiator protein dnaA|uniref:Chromosomal replication initiator protein DnaA n=2 Tax=Bifidobacteriaceae TaxID=31953 RepID=A0A9X7FFQ2_9BIFI|nr:MULTISPECIES: chromosomal replication initiator protein DnaA [Gardnerella]ADB14503.1 chromosomal replication initiator protein DnaA [Gardnerella vaginalis 409-05]APW18090.1 chromosomal replication initiation protein DnaA [Gardnerella vaginalis]EFH71312.1 chromosomal replication initiator protein DnaA [Gardnerella vaginalis 5-1]RFT32798.1 chromosomal replication initiation protein DnaA [Bifidobacteriaceae bacterium NR020]RIY26876.1 chromosomal replication initiator protein DnaA [Bifidobacter